MHKTHFSIDGIECFFEGYTDRTYWNGWATPWFTKEVADEILKINNETNGTDCLMTYNAETDTYARPSGFEDVLDEFQGKDFIINGETFHLYPIGNGCWIWDNIADYQSKEAKVVWGYLTEEYHYLKPKQFYDVYTNIIQEINGYMSEEVLKAFTDGFMTAYDRGRN